MEREYQIPATFTAQKLWMVLIWYYDEHSILSDKQITESVILDLEDNKDISQVVRNNRDLFTQIFDLYIDQLDPEKRGNDKVLFSSIRDVYLNQPKFSTSKV